MRGDGPAARSCRGVFGACRQEQGRGGLRAIGPAQSTADPDAGVGGLSLRYGLNVRIDSGRDCKDRTRTQRLCRGSTAQSMTSRDRKQRKSEHLARAQLTAAPRRPPRQHHAPLCQRPIRSPSVVRLLHIAPSAQWMKLSCSVEAISRGNCTRTQLSNSTESGSACCYDC